jgi:hypothetical protein
MGRSEKQKQRSGAGSRKSNVKKTKKPKRVKQRARKHTDKLKPRRQVYDNPRGGNALVGSSRQHARISRQHARMVGRNATRVEDVVDLTQLAAPPAPEPVNTAPQPRPSTPPRPQPRDRNYHRKNWKEWRAEYGMYLTARPQLWHRANNQSRRLDMG